MKQIIVFLFFMFFTCTLHAQSSYTIAGFGQGKNGAYMVKVTSVVKDVKTAKEVLRRNAVHGVLFRGFMNNSDGGTNQRSLIEDPSIERTKAEFFKAFWEGKEYEKYAQIIPSSLKSVKEKKMYEVSAVFLVDKESLLHYLEVNGIVQGFSNLW